MPFDLASAQPVKGFDLASAQPVKPTGLEWTKGVDPSLYSKEDAAANAKLKAQRDNPYSLEKVGRAISLAGRMPLDAATAIPLAAADAGVGVRNLITGEGAPSASSMYNEGLSKLGVASPNTRTEKVGQFVGTALMGSQLPIPQVKNAAPANFVSKAAATSESGLTPAQAQAAQAGKDLGMRLTPGKESGSKALQQLEAKLESQPLTSGPFTSLAKGNQEVLNTTWAKAIGEEGKTLDASTLGRAVDRLGNQFESFRSAKHIVAVDPAKTSKVIDGIEEEIRGLGAGKIRDNELVQDFEKLAQSGALNGQQLGRLSSKFGKAAYKQMSGANGDRDLGHALYAIKDHVDDLLGSGLSAAEKGAYDATRQQWRALQQLTSRVGNVNPSTGNVSGGAMANYLQQADKNGFLFGKNGSDAYQATRFAQAFKPIVGDSGTATRSTPALADLALGIPANLASRAYLTKPGSALAETLLKIGGARPSPGATTGATDATLPTISEWRNASEAQRKKLMDALQRSQ